MGNNDGGAVAGSFSLQAQLPNGKSLSFSGYVLQGEGLADINAKMDLAAAVVERQRLAAEVPELETKLKQRHQTRRELLTLIEDAVAAEQTGEREPSNQKAQRKQNLNTWRVSLKKIDDDIKDGEAAIAEAKKATAQQLAA